MSFYIKEHSLHSVAVKMRFISILLCICFQLLISIQGLREIPKELLICHRNDPLLNECLKNSIQSLLPKLKYGIPSLSFPPMDPYVTEDAKLNYTISDSLVGRFSVHQVNTYGLVQGRVENVSATFSHNGTVLRLAIEVFFKESYVKGNYKGLARIGLLPIRAGGPFNVTLSDTVISWLIYGKLSKKKSGEEFMEIRSFKFKPKVGDMKIHMEGLLGTFGRLLNGRWKYFVRQLMPETQNYFGPELVQLLNKIFMEIPYNELLPVKSEPEPSSTEINKVVEEK